MTHPTECRHCTVPTDGAAVCTFCAEYTPPPSDRHLADLAHLISEFAELTASAVNRIPVDDPIWAVVDGVAATAHLRAAARLLERAANR